MAVKYYNDGCDYSLPSRGKVSLWVRRTVEAEGYRLGPVNYIFCSSQRLLEMNRQYLGHDYYTDVITFDYSDLEAGRVSGDIFIDVDTVADNAAQLGVAAGEEMLRVVIHGVLHLCGYKDKSPDEEARMRAAEDLCLSRLGECAQAVAKRAKTPRNGGKR